MSARTEVPVPIHYDQTEFIEVAYRIDILVEDAIIVELKSVEAILPRHKAQLLTYLKHAQKKIGLLINFASPSLKNGIVRMVEKLEE